MSLKETFDALLNALNTQNKNTLEDLLAENFRFTGTVAQHRNKSERIKDILKNPVFANLRFRNSDFLMLENTCLVFCEFQYPGFDDSSLWFGRSTFVFSQIAGSWKLVAQHNSHVEA
jgi:hypothetical protein